MVTVPYLAIVVSGVCRPIIASVNFVLRIVDVADELVLGLEGKIAKRADNILFYGSQPLSFLLLFFTD